MQADHLLCTELHAQSTVQASHEHKLSFVSLSLSLSCCPAETSVGPSGHHWERPCRNKSLFEQILFFPVGSPHGPGSERSSRAGLLIIVHAVIIYLITGSS